MLLRSLAAARPAARRVWFTMVMSCRRRLGKRWEGTPLAKLFTLEAGSFTKRPSGNGLLEIGRVYVSGTWGQDSPPNPPSAALRGAAPLPSRNQDEWAMLKQRAQAVRVREAIRARGLLLHDAFIKFDYHCTGFLSLSEVGDLT
jgi:hypothetical protein